MQMFPKKTDWGEILGKSLMAGMRRGAGDESDLSEGEKTALTKERLRKERYEKARALQKKQPQLGESRVQEGPTEKEYDPEMYIQQRAEENPIFDLDPQDYYAQRDRNVKEGSKPYAEFEARRRSLLTQERDINNLEKLANDPVWGGVKDRVISSGAGLSKEGGFLSNLFSTSLSPQAQEWKKLTARFANGAQKMMGGRVTNFSLEKYMEQFPNIFNDPKTRLKLVKAVKLENNIEKVYSDNLNKVLKEFGGIGNISFSEAQALADEISEPQVEKMVNEVNRIADEMETLGANQQSKDEKSNPMQAQTSPMNGFEKVANKPPQAGHVWVMNAEGKIGQIPVEDVMAWKQKGGKVFNG